MKTQDSVAVISDVHGNTWALKAVLRDIELRGITQIINLGDSVYGPLDPGGAAELLMGTNMVSVIGNQDRILLESSENVNASSSFQLTMSALRHEHIVWLQKQKKDYFSEDIVCFHGAPASDEKYLLESVEPEGVFLASTESVTRQLEGIIQQVILCGHSHVPRTLWLDDGRLVVNPGSVGLPAYEDEVPYPHAMESGSPHTRYAILIRQSNGYSIEHVALPYPWEQAVIAARNNRREDWAKWLETGRV